MKPAPDTATTLAFGAHPDDIEFGCGGVIARETRNGRRVRFAVCSRGEAASHGTPRERAIEAAAGAEILGAALEFLDLGGDAHFQPHPANVIKLAAVIRRVQPLIVLAPTPVENQHPDHCVLGRMVRDAARVARYGGIKELQRLRPHAIGALLFYAITVESEPPGERPILVDVSDASVLKAWREAMLAHVTQGQTRPYDELQLTRAQTNGARCGVEAAIALYPNDPVVVDSLVPLQRGARRF